METQGHFSAEINTEAFLGRSEADIRWAFFDHTTLMSLGLGSIINVPVVHDGVTLGTINSSHREHFYEARHVGLIADLAPLLVPAFLELRQSVI